MEDASWTEFATSKDRKKKKNGQLTDDIWDAWGTESKSDQKQANASVHEELKDAGEAKDEIWDTVGSMSKKKKKETDLIQLDEQEDKNALDYVSKTSIDATGDAEFFAALGTGKKSGKKADDAIWKPDSIEKSAGSAWGAVTKKDKSKNGSDAPDEIIGETIQPKPVKGISDGGRRTTAGLGLHSSTSPSLAARPLLTCPLLFHSPPAWI